MRAQPRSILERLASDIADAVRNADLCNRALVKSFVTNLYYTVRNINALEIAPAKGI